MSPVSGRSISKTKGYDRTLPPRRYGTRPSGWEDELDLLQRMDCSPEQTFLPYIRNFISHWNLFIDKNSTLGAEVYCVPSSDGLVAVAFSPIAKKDKDKFPMFLQRSWEDMKKKYPKVQWSDMIEKKSFFDVVDDAIIVVKPNLLRNWQKKDGGNDADCTVRIRAFKTMPEEWKQLPQE